MSATAVSALPRDARSAPGKAIAATDRPLVPVLPLAVGDPVTAPAVGVRGTIIEVSGSEATVIGIGGLRVRIPIEQLRPDRDAVGADESTRRLP